MNQIVNGLHGTQAVLMRGDCLERMKELPAGGVDMVFCDLPYTHSKNKCTFNHWDEAIDIERVWMLMARACRNLSVFAFTATQPFASVLVASRPGWFRYDLVWDKISHASGFFLANKRPLRIHEHVLVFSKTSASTYNAQKTDVKKIYNQSMSPKISASYRCPLSKINKVDIDTAKKMRLSKGEPKMMTGRHPHSILKFERERGKQRMHTTQKPVALLEWLIRTYTNPGDTVLDPTAGSGTTAVAALNTGRNAICIEKDPTYFDVMCKRVRESYVPAAQAELALA